jgi:hypothetical protein
MLPCQNKVWNIDMIDGDVISCLNGSLITWGDMKDYVLESGISTNVVPVVQALRTPI